MGWLLLIIVANVLVWLLLIFRNSRRGQDERLEGASSALWSTVEALATRSEADLWPKLLESAVQAVPGAEAGSIRLRKGRNFVFVAQQGFGEGILGIHSEEEEAINWYGSKEGWRKGEPRIAHRIDLERIFRLGNRNSQLAHQLNRASSRGSIGYISSNLCIPIVLHDEVVAEINLDAFRDRVFSDRSVKIARQYALQVTALVASLRERNELETRIREFEVIEAVSSSLRGLKGLEGVTQRLVQETSRLMHSENAALLLLQPDKQSMRCCAAAGFFTSLNDDLIPRGRGVGWDALESRAPIWRSDTFSDSRAIGTVTQELVPYSQIAVPMLNSKSEALGVLISARNNSQAYTERDVRVLEVIANIAANTLERVWASDHLEAELREKQALLKLSQMLEGNSKEHINQALEYVRLLFGADAAVIGYFFDQRLYAHSTAGHLTPALQEHFDQGWPLEMVKPINRYLAKHQMVEGTPNPFSELMQQLGIKTHLAVTMGKDMPYGGLLLYRFKEAKIWNPEAVEMAKGCGRMLGAVVSRVEGSQRLEAAYEGALRAIGIALEARDRETAGHTDRVARMAEQVGNALALSPTELRDLRWGAYLHDIGKLAIPDFILLKPGKLTPEEFSTMKTHAALGDDLVRNLPFVPQAARQIVRHHHERIDGRGYPDGLSSGNIPLSARIFAVCDVFDALRSERPYKTALSAEAAATELWHMAQTGHLDPRLVEIFLKTQGLNKPRVSATAAS